MYHENLNQGWALIHAGRPDRAVEYGRKAVAAEPEAAGGYNLLVTALLNMRMDRANKDLVEARQLARTHLRLEPDNDVSYFLMARVHMEAGEYPEAENLIKEAVARNPVSALYWGLSGLIKLNSRQEEAALADFDRSLELNPTEVSALRCRAICLRRLGRDAESEAVLKTALSQDPEDSWLHSELAFSTLEKGKAGHSVDHFYEALRLSPESNLAGAGLTEALRRTNPFYRLAGWVLTVEERLTETRPVLKFFISLIIVGGLHYVLRESWPVAAYSLSLIYVAALFVRTYGHLPGNLALLGEGRTRHLLERKQVWLTLYGCSLATLFGLALVDAIVFQDAMWLAAAGWSLLLILLVTHVMGRRETIFHRVSFLAVAFLGSGAAGSLLLARDPGAILAVNGPRLGLIALWLGYIVTRRRAGNS